MSIYVSAHPGFQHSFSSTMSSIKKAGFDGVFLNANEREMKESDIATVRDYGLDIETLHLPYNRPVRLINRLWENRIEAEDVIAFLIKEVDFAASNAIPTVVLHASSGFNPPKVTTSGVKNFAIIAKYCLHKNIKLALENGKSTEHLSSLIRCLSDYDVGFCFDIGHANAFTKNLYSTEWLSALSSLSCVHIHDNDGEDDSHLIPGLGNINFRQVLRTLTRFNKSINLTLELYYKGRESVYGDMTEDEFFSCAYQSAITLNDYLLRR